MTIDTSEDYADAIARLSALGENPVDGPDRDAFFAINAAMVADETRNHPALSSEEDAS